MCLATIGTIAALAGTTMGAVGAYQSAQAQNKAAEANAEQATYNAGIADQQAVDAGARGAEEERRHRVQVAGLVGQQRSTLAGSGVVVDSGSGADLVGDTNYLGNQDADTIRENTAREVWSYENQAENFRMQSDMYGSQKVSPWMAAGTTLLGGGGALAMKYGDWRKTKTGVKQ